MSLSWQFSEDGILSKFWAEKCLIIASLILIFTSNDSVNLRNFKKTENFQKISFLNLIKVNILKKISTCVCSSVKPNLNYSFEKAIKGRVYVKVITLSVLDPISLTTLLSLKILLPMGCVRLGNFGSLICGLFTHRRQVIAIFFTQFHTTHGK